MKNRSLKWYELLALAVVALIVGGMLGGMIGALISITGQVLVLFAVVAGIRAALKKHKNKD